ncbi:hypothetical protein [Arthrobacter sp. TWP1-1]|uniref:hypothetical protein n=1 Tax=Arthrobacter sp. TWP1-1 TaxID=2804568 RepID=UPI003CEBABD3
MLFSVIALLTCYVQLINVILRCTDGHISTNGTIGLRTAMMTNEQTWLVGHKAAKKPTFTGIYAAMVFTIPELFFSGETWQLKFLLGLCLIVFIAVMVGNSKGKKAARLVLATRH